MHIRYVKLYDGVYTLYWLFAGSTWNGTASGLADLELTYSSIWLLGVRPV